MKLGHHIYLKDSTLSTQMTDENIGLINQSILDTTHNQTIDDQQAAFTNIDEPNIIVEDSKSTDENSNQIVERQNKMSMAFNDDGPNEKEDER